METNKSIRIIDELGRIVLPMEVRQAMEWDSKTPLEIRINAAENEVVLKRHALTCIFCGERENLKVFNNKHICPACQEEITKL